MFRKRKFEFIILADAFYTVHSHVWNYAEKCTREMNVKVH